MAHSPSPSASPNEQILRAQLFLDASRFKPGVVDGKWNELMRQALKERAKGEKKESPKFGSNPPADFDLPLDHSKPLTTQYQIRDEDQQWVGKVPESHAAQEKQDRLPYTSLLELVAEKFHAARDLLRQLNPGFDWDHAKPGDHVQVPDVATPFDISEPVQLKQKTEAAAKSNSVEKESDKPKSEQFQIDVDVSKKVLELHQGGKLVGSYPITPGSKKLPAPQGDWFVKGISWMPSFRWDEAMLQHGERSSHSYHLPPGPNNPVGIVWMDLNHEGTGIHGTEAPETIGHTTSHGCIRLTNWNALDLGKTILPGVHVHIH